MSGSTWSRTTSPLAVSLLLIILSAPAAARIKIDLQAEPLALALSTVATLANMNVIFDSTDVDGLRSPPLKAVLSVDEALARLLAGTGLRVAHVNQNTVIIVGTTPKRGESAYTPNTGAVYAAHSPSRLTYAGAAEGAISDRAAGAPNDANASGSNDAPASASPDRQSEIGEVIVSAQKRDERLIEVPQSISVLSSDALAKLGATHLSDFVSTVPGLSYQTNGAGFTDITLRGVTTGFDISPTVGVYVDDVPYGSSTTFGGGAQTALDVGLFDMDRVEVLRGPQGTLYGASTMGGLIKYVTRRPTEDSFSGNVQAGISGTHDGGISFNTAAVVNVPILADKMAVRASVFENRLGGYITNLAVDKKEVDRGDIYGGRLDLLATPTEALSIRVTGFLQNISRNGESTADYAVDGGRPYGGLGQYRVFAEPFQENFRLASGTVAYDFGPVSLTSISSYQSVHEDNVFDISALYVPIFQSLGLSYTAVGVPNDQITNKFTQELRLTGKKTGPIEWMLGGFYNHESSKLLQYLVFRDTTGNLPPDLTGSLSDSTYEEYSVFGNLTWSVTSKFDITAGLRQAHDQQNFSQPPSSPVLSDETVRTYLGNARYKITDYATTYVRYATGYRPGGPNFRTTDPLTGELIGPPTFAADKLRSYEIGLKAETPDRRYGFDVDAYNIDWDNIQVLAQQDGFAYRSNAPGGARVTGSELSVTARPIRELNMTGAFAYQHAYLKDDVLALGATGGTSLPNVPRFTAAVGADYESQNQQLRPTVGVTVRYIDARIASISPPAGFTGPYNLPPYTSVDLRAGVAISSIKVQAYVHNIFDERGQVSDLFPQFAARIALIQPRTIGVLVTAAF